MTNVVIDSETTLNPPSAFFAQKLVLLANGDHDAAQHYEFADEIKEFKFDPKIYQSQSFSQDGSAAAAANASLSGLDDRSKLDGVFVVLVDKPRRVDFGRKQLAHGWRSAFQAPLGSRRHTDHQGVPTSRLRKQILMGPIVRDPA
jgi:hypothetical protein